MLVYLPDQEGSIGTEQTESGDGDNLQGLPGQYQSGRSPLTEFRTLSGREYDILTAIFILSVQPRQKLHCTAE